MRIVIAVHHFPPTFSGGAEWRAYRTARHLIDRGHDVRVIYVESVTWGDGSGLWAEDATFQGIPVRRLSFNLDRAPDPIRWQYRNPWVGQAVADFIREFQPHLLHLISGYLMTSSAIEAARAAGLPVVLTLTDFWFLCPRINLVRSDGRLCQVPEDALDCFVCLQEERRRYRLPDRLSRGRLGALLKQPVVKGILGLADAAQAVQARRSTLLDALQHVDVAISPSRFLGELLQARGARPRRLLTMRQGLDTDNWLAVEPSIAHRGLQIGFIGQIAPHKGVDVLIDAFRRLGRRACRRADDAPQLTIYGDPERSPRFAARLAQQAAGEPCIKFGGVFPNQQVAQVLAALDVIVVPSVWYENSPNIILEAFATRTPVVASDLGGMAELVQHEQNGLLFRVGDPADLARQLQRFIDEPELLPRLRKGIGPVKRVEEEITELIEVYQSLVTDTETS
jgi:glycosyltransferase involved in cell wall biosynthesis